MSTRLAKHIVCALWMAFTMLGAGAIAAAEFGRIEFWLSAFLSGALVGAVVLARFISAKRSIWWGAIGGALAGLAFYPIYVLALRSGYVVDQSLYPTTQDVSARDMMTLYLFALLHFFVFTFWLILPLAAVAGAVLQLVWRRHWQISARA